MTGPFVFAAIDVGSHSVKLRLAARTADGGWQTVRDAVTVTGLGRGQPHRGLDPDGQARTLAALAAVAGELARRPVAGTVAAGTGVLRHAPDAADFLARVRERTGLEVAVIAGEEEARLTYLGARDGLVAAGRLPAGAPLIACDIGGASTEFAWGDGQRPAGRRSLPLGTISLSDRFGLGGVTADGTVAAAREHADRGLAALPPWPAAALLVGIGATPASLVALRQGADVADAEVVQGATLDAADIAAQVARLQRTPLADRRRLPGLHPGRAPVILGGAVLCAAVLARAGSGPLVVSAHGLRRGLLVDRFGGG